MKSGSNLEQILRAGHFAFTGELGPPRGSNVAAVRDKAKHLVGMVDAVNITDNQTAMVRMSSWAASLIAIEEGLEPNYQMVCRDRNRLAMQADILGASALGIRNLLCLSGDHQQFGDHPQAKGVFDIDSTQLIGTVKKMRDEAKFLGGADIDEAPKMFIGGAANPFAEPHEWRVHRLAKKVHAGVDFVQTQCIYNMDRMRQWVKEAVDMGIAEKVYILAGVTPMKSVGMARYMQLKVPGMDVPNEIIKRLQGVDKKKVADEGIKIACEQIEEFKEMKGVAGVHLMAIEWEHKVPEIAERAKVLAQAHGLINAPHPLSTNDHQRSFQVSNETKKVMVIGGGIAGLTAAWELAGLGAQVALVEKADFLGGHAIQYACKATDECRQCGACAVESMLKNVVNEPAITVHLATEVAGVNKNGNFTVSLKKSQTAKDLKACENAYTDNPTGCAAVRGYSLNNGRYYQADGSLNPETTGNADTLEVDAVVVATGFVPFDPRLKSTYRYDDLKNVVSGMDLETGKRANGTVLRPSDGKPPKKVAFIQCVGSRDERLGHLWCSQVCCPYALRTAQAMKYKDPELDITVFYMDIQNTGNDFPVFYQQCKDEMKFVRNIPVDMYETEDDRIRTRFMTAEGSSEVVEDEFDLVVLSVGIMPAADNATLSETVGAPLNGDGFFACADKLNRASTGQAGIFVAGTASGPKTIAESIVHAGQSAGEVMKYLGRAS